MVGSDRHSASLRARRVGSILVRRQTRRLGRRTWMVEVLEDRMLLSTFTVNSLGDAGVGTGLSGDLRYVITQADQTAGDNTIDFAVTGTITLNSALPDLSNTTGLTDIEGPGASSLTVARSGASGTPDFRIFTVDADVQAEITGLSISGGSSDGAGGGIENSGILTVTNSTIADNSAGGNGGGIESSGILTVNDSTIVDNSTGMQNVGGGIDNDGGTTNVTDSTIDDNSSGWFGDGGGGIENDGGTTNVTDSTIDDNDQYNIQSRGGGGGIRNDGGTTNVTDSTIDNNRAGEFGGSGGGIDNEGSMTITDSTIDNNSARGHDENSYRDGGGIVNNGSMTITDSAIDNNSADIGGGGISNNGTLTVINSTIADNSAAGVFNGNDFGAGNGGGIENSGTLTVTDSTIANNSAFGDGGGVVNSYGTLSVTDSTIDDNSAGRDGGGVNSFIAPLTVTDSTIANNSAGGDGGGIADLGSMLTVTDSTISNNSAGKGGGIDSDGGSTTSINSTIAYNNVSSGGTGGGLAVNDGAVTILDNTVVALNTIGTGSGATASDIFISPDNPGTVSSTSAYNLIGTGGSGGLVNGVNGNQVGIADPGLGTLANNGGPTQTIALLPGSPAIDIGSNALAVDPTTGQPLATDQRGPGFVRIINGTVDIGAYEFTPDAADSLSVTWGTQTAALVTAADGLRLLPAGRNIDLPWLGIDQLPITLSQAYPLTAGDIFISSAIGVNYGPVTVSGSGTNYTITLAQPINAADLVTLIVDNPGVSAFYRQLDVLPGDFNDDGVVNSQDLVGIRNEWLRIGGAKPTIFGDINGDGAVNAADYNDVRQFLGTSLQTVSDTSIALSPASQAGPAPVRMGASTPSPRTPARRARPAPRSNCRGEDRSGGRRSPGASRSTSR